MRFKLLLFLAFWPATVQAQADPVSPRQLWAHGEKSVWSVPCGPEIDGDGFCNSIQARQGREAVTPRFGYNSVRLLWRQTLSGVGPAAVLVGDTGGSAGMVDIFAVTFGKRPQLQRIESRDIARVEVKDGLLELETGFALTAFNGAPNSQTANVGLLLRWNGSAFEADLPAMRSRSARIASLAVLRAEVLGQEKTGLAGGGTPLLAQAMLELTLSGHGDRARSLLEAAWPQEVGRRTRVEARWQEFCGGVVSEPAWSVFGLGRLPNAEMVEAAGHRYEKR